MNHVEDLQDPFEYVQLKKMVKHCEAVAEGCIAIVEAVVQVVQRKIIQQLIEEMRCRQLDLLGSQVRLRQQRHKRYEFLERRRRLQ